MWRPWGHASVRFQLAEFGKLHLRASPLLRWLEADLQDGRKVVRPLRVAPED